MQTIHRQDSYYEEYKRNQFEKENIINFNKTSNTNKLMTDRSSYMAFLEVELERVSAACMTVQAYKERLSEIHKNHNELEEKLQQYSRALKLSSTMMDRRDHETNHKMENLTSRLNVFERKLSQIGTDTKMFLNSDMPIIYNEVQNIVKKQLMDITEKYANVEKRCHEMIHQRLDGYHDVYNALEKKLNNLLQDQLEKYEIKLMSNNERLKQWMNNLMIDNLHSMNDNIKHIETSMNEKINNLENKLNQELKGFIKENIKSILKDTKYKTNYRNIGLQNKLAERAEIACNKIADDVYKKLQNQRYDLIKHIRNVESRISEQLKDTMYQFNEKQEEDTKIKNVLSQNKVKKGGLKKRSKSMTDKKLLSKQQKIREKDIEDAPVQILVDNTNTNTNPIQDQEEMNMNSLRNEILDYKSEMLYSQQKLNDLENKFSEKLKLLQSQCNQMQMPLSDNVTINSSSNLNNDNNLNDSVKLKELDRKYSDIQNSITGLQRMIQQYNPESVNKKNQTN